ncbi:hypothetical protein C8Q79DRAFT_988226 [Trametes meyenii]|nr:hypothetical protein C8Q79DRAFT_988226 [Trametes meyenii]
MRLSPLTNLTQTATMAALALVALTSNAAAHPGPLAERQTCGIAECDLHAIPDPCAVCSVPGQVTWVCTDVQGNGNGQCVPNFFGAFA